MSFEFKSARHFYLEMKQRKVKKKVTFQVANLPYQFMAPIFEKLYLNHIANFSLE